MAVANHLSFNERKLFVFPFSSSFLHNRKRKKASQQSSSILDSHHSKILVTKLSSLTTKPPKHDRHTTMSNQPTTMEPTTPPSPPESPNSPKDIKSTVDNQDAVQSPKPSKEIKGATDHQEPLKTPEPAARKRKRSFDDFGTSESPSSKRSKSADYEEVPKSFMSSLKRSNSFDHFPLTPISHETRDAVELASGSIDFGDQASPAAHKAEETCKTAAEKLALLVSQPINHMTPMILTLSQAESVPANLAVFGSIEPKGFYNPDVLCYRNSAVQLLLHNPKFVSWLGLYHTKADCKFQVHPLLS